MSKDKKLRKIVIDKLFNKNDHHMKQSTRSNAPTESTPNQPKNFAKTISNFFQNFETQCALIYEPVKLNNQKPLKRCLEEELIFLYRNDMKLKLKTEESLFSNMPIHLLKSSQKKPSHQLKNESQTRNHTQSSSYSSKIKQKRIISTYSQIQKFKYKSILFNSTSPSETKPSTRLKQNDFERNLSTESSQALRMQKSKIPNQRSTLYLGKQDDQYATNSKNYLAKNIPKNAPKKMQCKPQKIDRIKRIQSLKNLNQSSIRKYSYKRDL